MAQWQLQQAKQRFSELIRDVERGDPAIITRHGQEVAAVVDINEYRQAHPKKPEKSFLELLQSFPLSDDDDWLPPRGVDPEPEYDWLEGW